MQTRVTDYSNLKIDLVPRVIRGLSCQAIAFSGDGLPVRNAQLPDASPARPAPQSVDEVRVYGQFIDGTWTPWPEPEAALERVGPGTGGRVVARFTRGTSQDVSDAVGAARRSFDEGPWPRMSGIDRGRALLRLAGLLREHSERFARIEAQEVGKPIRLARGDVDACVDMIEYAGGLAMATTGDAHTNLGETFHSWTVREPVGVVAMVTPWNFPLLQLVQKLPFALGSGCTAVVKPSEMTSSTTLELALLAQQAGVPDGVISVVTGEGKDVGQALAESPEIDLMSFTGSTATGQAVSVAAAANATRLSLELGGKAATIVCADADLDDALDGTLFGLLFNQGECCVSGARLLVEQSIADEFLDRLVSAAAAVRVGPPLDEDTEVGALISPDHVQKVLSFLAPERLGKGRVLTGGEIRDTDFVTPTIVDDVTPDSALFQEEIFGPVLAVTRFRDLDEAIQLANAVDYGLANSIWSKNVDKTLMAARRLRSGRVWINTTIDGSAQLPAGGMGASGYGREMGRQGFDEFTELKSVQLRTGPRERFFAATRALS
ncbi:MAG: aldehyde dehydrogenase family protein [Nocardioides sp.]|uniref:aldehyde dehydrogenase family protein n=1 Tax=Nocardioides sp. TaxID=35761 RepID=UPI0039E63849